MSSSPESTQTSASKTLFLEPHAVSEGTLPEQTRRELAHWKGVIPGDRAALNGAVKWDVMRCQSL